MLCRKINLVTDVSLACSGGELPPAGQAGGRSWTHKDLCRSAKGCPQEGELNKNSFHKPWLQLSKSGLDRSVSFRCGLFFPDPAGGPKPVGALLILNGSWVADECSGGVPSSAGVDRYNRSDMPYLFIQIKLEIINLTRRSFCDSIVVPISTRLTLADPSLYRPNADKGLSIGDDVCGYKALNVLFFLYIFYWSFKESLKVFG